MYEVNIAVRNEIAEEYAIFLDQHIREMLLIDGFLSAESYQRRPEDEKQNAQPGSVLWTVHYHVESREKLDRYFKEKAAEMRAEPVRRFGSQMTIDRRILHCQQKY